MTGETLRVVDNPSELRYALWSGATLVAGALDDVRAHGKQARPVCPFVAAHLKRHPEYADVVA